MRQPAILGGDAAFNPPLPFTRPTIEDSEKVAAMIADSLHSGMVTNGPRVAELEERVAERFDVSHCVAVASGTTGLMLVSQALTNDRPAVVPSFTFSATAHALAWNGITPLFVDCDPTTWCLRPEDIPVETGLVIGVHVSGVPCNVQGLEDRCREIGADLMFDAAHGSGSRVAIGDTTAPLGGFGRAEVFSLTPTKVMSGAEGGLVTTDDANLAEHIRMGRDYGNPGDYDTRFAGLNGRLSELNAALALASLEHLEERVEYRNGVAGRYREALDSLAGVSFQEVRPGDRSSYKDFTILVEGEEFGISRDDLVLALHAEGIPTRPYYSPPVHRQRAYSHLPERSLPVTDHLATQVVSLPIWSHLPLKTVEVIAETIGWIQASASRITGISSGDGPR